MLLKNKQAIIYGAAGSIGRVVAHVFAREGATVHVVGRTLEKVKKLADEIIVAGGKALAAKVDAMNEKEVNEHIKNIVENDGRVDISFNLIDINNVQNIALTEMNLSDFVQPVTDTLHTQFITATAAGRVMSKQKSGVILSLTATPGGVGYPQVGGFGVACAAQENFMRSLAVELGVYGVRAVNIRSAGSPDSRPFAEGMKQDPETLTAVINQIKSDTMLKDMPSVNDIANIAVFLASDMASKLTGITLDATVGTTEGLNYRTTGMYQNIKGSH